MRRRAFQLVTTTVRAQVFAITLVADRRLSAVNDWESEERRITNGDVKQVTRKYLLPRHPHRAHGHAGCEAMTRRQFAGADGSGRVWRGTFESRADLARSAALVKRIPPSPSNKVWPMRSSC